MTHWHLFAATYCRMLGWLVILGLSAPLQWSAAQDASLADLRPGQEMQITPPAAGVPPTLYSLMTGTEVPACVTVRLPDDYEPTKSYPLVIYVPGNDGGPKGNIHNARTIAGTHGRIAATLPLFKKRIDRAEVAGGVLVSFEDYPVISQAFGTLLGALFERIPNIDRDRSALVGFSNGAITTAILLSCHDEFVLAHFRKFCLVDHGMFHLTDLHKSGARDAEYLILVGDKDDMGRQEKIQQCQLLAGAWKLINVDVEYRILENTGHEFKDPQMKIVHDWLEDDRAGERNTSSSKP